MAKQKTPAAKASKTTGRKASKPAVRAIPQADEPAQAPAAPAEEFETVTLEQALEAAGQTLDDLKVGVPVPKQREPGSSNLAQTIRNHRKAYNVALAPNGKKTQNTGDWVAAALLNVPFPELVKFGVAFLGGQSYDHLNPGHARMCLGNKVRAAVRKDDSGVILWLQSFQPKAEEENAAE